MTVEGAAPQPGEHTDAPPEKSPGPSRAFWLRGKDLASEGRQALEALPGLDELRGLEPAGRNEVLQRLRVELYAIASIVADATVNRALSARASYPPFGLVRSMFTEFRIIADRPEPVNPEYIDGFFRLGRACIDTMVFHLDAEIQDMRHSERSWMSERLARLLPLYADGASREVQARMRDPFSFMYGGLQFGTSTMVQLLEVMSRLLDGIAGLSVSDKMQIMRRSVRPAHQLSAVNVDQIVPVYTRLQPASPGGKTGGPAGWMDAGRFVIEKSGDAPRRISLREDAGVLSPQATHGTYKTQGCPARVSPAGGSSISSLWAWFVDLSEQTGLVASGA